MKREPLTTTLTNDELQCHKAKRFSGDEVVPQLAVVSKIFKNSQDSNATWLVCRSLTEHGRTVFVPRYTRYTVEIRGSYNDRIEIEDIPMWAENIYGQVDTWVEVGDHIVYFTNDEDEMACSDWVFGRRYAICIRRIESQVYYRILVDKVERYFGTSYLEATRTSDTFASPKISQFGEKLQEATGQDLQPPQVDFLYRYGPNGEWEPFEPRAA